MVPDMVEVPGPIDAPAIAPPSKVAGFPNVPVGEVPKVEHAAAPLLVLGTVTVPVRPFGTGVTTGDAPNCRPFGPTGAPGADPSDEVTPSGGMVVPTWANAGLQHNKGHAAVTINKCLMEDTPVRGER
jgi:hypothetical protein